MPPAEGREPLRTSKACVACSIKKIRCDGNDPCAYCIRTFNGECFYTASKKRGPPKGAPARGGWQAKSRKLANQKAASSSSTADSNKGSSPGNAAATASGSGNVTANADGRTATADGFTNAEPTVPQPSHLATPVQSAVPQLFTLMPGEQAGGGGGGGLDTSLSDSLLSGFDISHTDIEFPISDGRLLSPSSVRTGAGQSPTPSLPAALSINTSYARQIGLTSAAIDDLILVYETFIHQHWPIIYLPALPNLLSLETQCPLLFDAVLAIGAANSYLADNQDHLLPTEKVSLQPLHTLCDLLTESVRQRVGNLTTRDHRPTLQAVQAIHMVALVDLGCGRKSLAYQMSGLASRMAFDLGLHTNRMAWADATPSTSSTSDDHCNDQERSRTIWACFILDKILAAIVQRPPLVRLADLDAPRPSVMERDELELWLSGGAQQLLHPNVRKTMRGVKSHTLSSFNGMIDIMTILELILDHIYRAPVRRARMEGIQVDRYDEAVVNIDAELHRFRANLAPHLQWSDDEDSAHDNVGLHHLTMRAWYYVCMLLLHRPQVPYLDPASPENEVGGGGDTSPASYKPAGHSSYCRLPNGAEASRNAATAICTIMESYNRVFLVRKFSSSWVYLLFQAGTVHGGLAARGPDPPTTGSSSTAAHHLHHHLALTLSPARAESYRRLEQCIGWLEKIALQWHSASRHVEILRKLSAMSARTRPPTPDLTHGSLGTGTDQLALDSLSPFQGHGDPMSGVMPLDLDAWMLLWASMPAAGDDISLWQQCFPNAS